MIHDPKRITKAAIDEMIAKLPPDCRIKVFGDEIYMNLRGMDAVAEMMDADGYFRDARRLRAARDELARQSEIAKQVNKN